MQQMGVKQFGGLIHFVAKNFGETMQIDLKQFGEMQINAYFCLKISIRQWQYNSREVISTHAQVEAGGARSFGIAD